jgi:hypothetical protein
MRSALLAVAVLASGCAAHLLDVAQLTQAGAQVRSVPAEGVARCTRLAAVAGSGANYRSTAENEEVATVDVRNQVAQLGGNAFSVTARTVRPWRTVVQADALRCPEWEPVPGLLPR